MDSSAIAVFHPTNDSDISGFVRFDPYHTGTGTVVTFALSGLTPGAKHAIHVHEFGDTSMGCESLGGHLNPAESVHGSMWLDDSPFQRHAGDLINNLIASRRGDFQFKYFDPLLLTDGSSWGVLGRSVVIHAGEDDLGRGGTSESLKTGSAGARLACAVIGRAGPTGGRSRSAEGAGERGSIVMRRGQPSCPEGEWKGQRWWKREGW